MISTVIDTEVLADISTSVCLQFCTVSINFSSLLVILYFSPAIYFCEKLSCTNGEVRIPNSPSTNSSHGP